MSWNIRFYNAQVETDLLALPPGIQARMLKLLELMQKHGANLGAPHTKPLGDGLFEIRAKAREGIGRSMFCYLAGEEIVILSVFVKKTNKIPRHELATARKRLQEVTS